ncbi:hypothetical protein GE21DRAFT_1088205 [Neurospora crassa]|nr:hypothetical protein GE21DRAFT_1088205 [Neurospora crassa]
MMNSACNYYEAIACGQAVKPASLVRPSCVSNSLNRCKSAACFPLSGPCMCNQTVCEVGVMLGIFGSLFALAEPLVLRLSGIGLTARKLHNHGSW